MNDFTVTYRNKSSRQFVRTATAADAKSAVAKVQEQQRNTNKEVYEIVSVVEWRSAAADAGEFVELDQLQERRTV